VPLLQLGEPRHGEEALEAMRRCGVRMTKVAPSHPAGYAVAGRAAMDQTNAGLAYRCAVALASQLLAGRASLARVRQGN
jgi:hypothetical protein